VDNQTALGLLSICGIVAVLILLGSFLLIRIMKSSVFGIANMVLRSVTDPAEVKTTTVVHAQTAHPDFRTAAKSVDFDAAVASHKGEVTPSVRTAPTTPPTSPVQASAFTITEETPTIGSRQRKRLRRQHIDDEEDGEMFEGLLGD
jgi:hypothetical protein